VGEDDEDEVDGQAREKSVGLGDGDLVSDSYLEIKPLLEPEEVIVSVMDCRRVQVPTACSPAVERGLRLGVPRDTCGVPARGSRVCAKC
jgi:hypothetical protein